MSKLKILVTGANGFVGRALCAEAIRRDMEVIAVTRSPLELPAGGQNVVMENIVDADNWHHVFDGCEVVIHLAARVHIMRDDAADPLDEFRKINVHMTESLARATVEQGVKRLVYVSSIKVNGEATEKGEKFTEAGVPAPQDAYGLSKWEAEQVLHRVAAETGLEVVIVRPPLVYGPSVKGNFEQMLKALGRGIPLPLASANNLRSLVYVGNLVDALILCARHPAAAGQTYLVSDGKDVSTPDLLRHLGVAMGRQARLLSCPEALLKLGGRLLGKAEQIDRLLESLLVDDSKIRRELDWTPPYSLEEGLRATAESLAK